VAISAETAGWKTGFLARKNPGVVAGDFLAFYWCFCGAFQEKAGSACGFLMVRMW
jgi:hypothetical protein